MKCPYLYTTYRPGDSMEEDTAFDCLREDCQLWDTSNDDCSIKIGNQANARIVRAIGNLTDWLATRWN